MASTTDSFDIREYLTSIVGDENFHLEIAKGRLQAALQKGQKDQLVAVWALVLTVLFLEEAEFQVAQSYLRQAYNASNRLSAHGLSDLGLNSICDLLQQKTIELMARAGLNKSRL